MLKPKNATFGMSNCTAQNGQNMVKNGMTMRLTRLALKIDVLIVGGGFAAIHGS
jgi:hypothetical protein